MRVKRADFLVDQLVEDISLPGLVAEIGDRIADLIKGQMMYRSCFGNHVLFDHQAAHIVGTVEQRHLTDLLSLSNPARLQIGKVVEIQPGDSIGFEVLETARRRNVVHIGMIGLKCPADESSETAGFVLQLTKSLEMFDAFGQVFPRGQTSW